LRFDGKLHERVVSVFQLLSIPKSKAPAERCRGLGATSAYKPNFLRANPPIATNPDPRRIKDDGSGTVAVPALTLNCVPGDQPIKLSWKLRIVVAPIPGPPKNVTWVPFVLIEQLSKGPFAAQLNGPCVLFPEIEIVKLVQFFPLKFENWQVGSNIPPMSQLAVPVLVEKLNDVPVIAKLC
jgi:hypothetical protein